MRLSLACPAPVLKGGIWPFDFNRETLEQGGILRIIIISIIFFTYLFIADNLFAYVGDNDKKNESIAGLNKNENFSLYQSNYFIVGLNDLKLQFSVKYRIAKAIPLYLGFTQIMFWNIYDESKPFKDINYIPEAFYRLLDKKNDAFKTLDMGYLHTSNGKKGADSRSLDRIFLRANYLTNFNRHNLDLNLMMFYVYNKENTNEDIVDHMGYWDLKMTISDLIVYDKQSLDFEVSVFAGSKVINLNQGAYQFGLVYNFASSNMNPAIYLQMFNGYCENLLDYNKRHEEYRIGLLLSY